MNTSENWLSILDTSKVVNDVLVGLTVAMAGWIIYLTWEWIKNKKAKRRTITILLSEIKDIQKELKPLSNCRNKAHNEYDNLSEEDRLPEELNFYSNIYSNVRDKSDLLNAECQIKLSQYYKKIETIKKEYKKFEIIHGRLPEILSIVELRASKYQISPSVGEIDKFLENIENVYELGEELTMDLEKIKRVSE